MPRDFTRPRELLPGVLLTLLSVVQALVLETLWSTVQESSVLFAGGLPAWIGWLQVAAVFQGIVIIWLFYISIVPGGGSGASAVLMMASRWCSSS